MGRARARSACGERGQRLSQTHIMARSYRYRLRPTRTQVALLEEWLRLTRELYNAALEERRGAWEKRRVSISLYDQCASLPAVREFRPEFGGVPIVVQRGALRRIDKAFKAFFRRCKAGEAPGYPRFKGRRHFTSVLVDDLAGRNPITGDGKRVKIPIIGGVKFKQHRPIGGTPKAMRLTTDAAGRWYVTLACVDVPTKPLPETGSSVGVDLGLTTFAATSSGQMFANPRALKSARIEVERAQRAVTRRCRGSRRREKARILLATRHEHVAAVRREHHIQVARALVAKHDVVCVENLNVKGLARGQLAKSVNDAGWGSFLGWLRVKAEEAGREVVEVNPSGTSQNCSGCGCEVRKSLAVRVHRCPHCGLVLDRDVNAARNILGLGMGLRGAAPAVGGRHRSAKRTNVRQARNPPLFGGTP